MHHKIAMIGKNFDFYHFGKYVNFLIYKSKTYFNNMYFALYLVYFTVFVSTTDELPSSAASNPSKTKNFVDGALLLISVKERVNTEIKPKLKLIREKYEEQYEIATNTRNEQRAMNRNLIAFLYYMTTIAAMNENDDVKLVIETIQYVQLILFNVGYEEYKPADEMVKSMFKTYCKLYLRTSRSVKYVLNKYCLTDSGNYPNLKILSISSEYLANICNYTLLHYFDKDSALYLDVKYFILSSINENIAFLNKIVEMFIKGYQVHYMLRYCSCGLLFTTSRLYVAIDDGRTLCTLCLVEEWIKFVENYTDGTERSSTEYKTASSHCLCGEGQHVSD